MTERLRPLVRVGGRRRGTLEVALPDEPDGAARRDGLLDTQAPATVGRRAWTLVQIVGATPLAFWQELTGAAPDRIVTRHAGRRELLDGWVLAATRQRDAAWLRALLAHRHDPGLLAALPPADAHAALAAALPSLDDDAAAGALAAVAGPWPLDLSGAVVARLERSKSGLAAALPPLATRLHPDAAPAVDAWGRSLPEDHPARRRVHDLARSLSIRQTIARELS